MLLGLALTTGTASASTVSPKEVVTARSLPQGSVNVAYRGYHHRGYNRGYYRTRYYNPGRYYHRHYYYYPVNHYYYRGYHHRYDW